MPILSITRVTDASGAQFGIGDIVNSYMPAISGDGSKVLLALSGSRAAADTNNLDDVYVKTLSTGALSLVNATAAGVVGNAASSFLNGRPLSNDGDKVLFYTAASNLAGATDTNGVGDLYVKTLSTGAVQRVATSSAGAEVAGTIQTTNAFLSLDGGSVIFSTTQALDAVNDTNGVADIYRKTLATGAVQRLSTTSAGAQISGVGGATLVAASADGNKIAFLSADTTLVTPDTNGLPDLFVKDLVSGAVTRVNVDTTGAVVNGSIWTSGAFSPDATKFAFITTGALMTSDTNGAADVYVRTLTGGPSALQRATSDAAGAQFAGGLFTSGGGDDGFVSFSPDGSKLAFSTGIAALASDTNGLVDVYLKNLTTGGLELASTNPTGTLATGGVQSYQALYAANADVLIFATSTTNLVTPDTNGTYDFLVVGIGTPAAPGPPLPPPSAAPTVNTNFSAVLRYQTATTAPLPPTVTTPDGKVVPNPMLEQQKQIAALIAQVDAGLISLKFAQDLIVDMADATTSVATLSYQFFTGKIPTREGLDYLVSSPNNPNDLNDGYYAGFNLENRYINFAVNLGKLGEGAAKFSADYGSLSITDAATKAYTAIFGFAPAPGKIGQILDTTRLDYLKALGEDDIGTKAAIVGFFLAEAAKADLGPYAVQNENFLYDLLDGSANFGVDASTYLNTGPTFVKLIGIG